MKVLIGAATMAVLLCGAAAAQETLGAPPSNFQAPASRCAALPTAPSLPDGGSAEAADMQLATNAFQTWEAAYREVLACRRTEAQEAQAIQQARTQEFNGGVQSYNATVASWTAEVEEFNGRQNRRRRP
jgi:hypothetical protein